MRPSDVFGYQRLSPSTDLDSLATPLASGGPNTCGSLYNDSTAASGAGIVTAQMMSYFLAHGASVDAALDAASRDSKSFQTAAQHTRHPYEKPQMAHLAHAVPTSGYPAGSSALLLCEEVVGTADIVVEDDNSKATVPSPAEVLHQHQNQARHAHTQSTNTVASHPASIPPNFSPLFSQSSSTSLFGTPGLGSLSAMSSPASRRDSLSGSLMMEDSLISSGGDGLISGEASLTRALEIGLRRLGADGTSTIEQSSEATSTRRLGKTSLIKAIVQSCPHIVHVDLVPHGKLSISETQRPSAAAVTGSTSTHGGGQDTIRARRELSRSIRSDESANQITEFYASTKPYPKWRSEVDAESGSQRRQSFDGDVLDRNICFVDTPGFTRSTSTADSVMPVIEYVEGCVQKICTASLKDTDFVSLLSGDGGSAVDVVFYLVADILKPADIEYLRLLTPLTSVIPLLARADALQTETSLTETKEKIARQLREANIQPFVFTSLTASQDSAPVQASASGLPLPYSVSSANGCDHEVMDASLLMSPDYVQPLVPSELAALVQRVFCPDGISRLRYSTAEKIARWRRSNSPSTNSNNEPSRPLGLYRYLEFDGDEPNQHPANLSSAAAARAGVRTAPLGAPLSCALARTTERTQMEEHLAQIQLASWAAELQRRMDRERAGYETLARNERAVWLTERLSECVQNGTLVAVPPTAQILQWQQQQQVQSFAKGHRKKSKSRRSAAASPSLDPRLSRSVFSHEDPLGLLEVTAGLRARGIVVMQVLGSLGVLGGLALLMIRHNYHPQLCERVACEWTKLRNGLR
ncbi:hypothetical protein SEPCBS119000_006314 [Sporothrix epigloea]|uniref:Septin-type G domain-containing protein n=1 Tax=Sporothrix epigloea TaxID=1892477 RepID=A0ABP0E2C7_9PEZI